MKRPSDTSETRKQPQDVWSMEEWARLEERTRARALAADSEEGAARVLNRHARRVMRAYTTSFFIVSRFLPAAKRAEVEAVYAAVRFPDEIVDTFPLSDAERRSLLDLWQGDYEVGLQASSIKEALLNDVPCPLAAFTKVVRQRGIPHEHYRAFLDAMRRDTSPRPFDTLEDLIENYIYGSAVVVGYFLTHVYGARDAGSSWRAFASARNLAVALQLTNFLRDVGEDQMRGRVYIPLDALRTEGIEALDTRDPRQQESLSRVLRRLAGVAADFYARAEAELDAFSPDCRRAVHACIRVYGRLNERIAAGTQSATRRESVPLREKFGALPPSKYWRIPLAYLSR